MSLPDSCRPYRQKRRKDTTDQTRERILEATRELFADETNALEGFTLDAVARRANVTRVTVYHHFRSKAGLADGLCGYLGDRGGMDQMPDVFRLEDPLRALEAYFYQFGRFWAADRVTMRRLRAVAVLDPDAARAMTVRDEQRKGGTRQLVERVLAVYPLPGGTDKEAVVRAVSLLTSFESFDALAGAGEDPREAPHLLFTLALGVLGVPQSP